MVSSCDVLVIGAGAAGLSACRTLSRAGVQVLCVEARDRIGGRILTLADPLSPLPIELGPEFVHGRPPESWELIAAAPLTVYDCAENAVHVVAGKVQHQSDSWEQIEAITAAMKQASQNGDDLSFAAFLQKTDFPPQAKQLATSYVEGFNAARKEEISVASLAADAQAADAIAGHQSFRLASGYDSFLRALRAGIDQRCCRFHLSSVVEHVRWSPAQTEVTVRSAALSATERFHARRIVVTLPLGVLQAAPGQPGVVEFSPPVERILNAARALRFGHVMRLVLRFRHPWWEENPDLADAGFWLSQERYFPTWWTTLPVRSSLLTGWSAGPHADELLGHSKDQIVQHALRDLAKVAHTPVETLARLLEQAHFHPWHEDPYARGAYSYVPAGAMHARQTLAEPVEDTLFFAGEATETEGHSATVHGAIASGNRAARQVLASLSRGSA